jgi:hypothetical protein
MRPLPAPLRFLAGICLGWIALRAGILWLAPWGARAAETATVSTPWANAPLRGAPPPAASPARGSAVMASAAASASLVPAIARSSPDGPRPAASFPAGLMATTETVQAAVVAPRRAATNLVARETSRAVAASPVASPPAFLPARAEGGRRWSLSGWAFVRPGGGVPLAPGGMLGGSQAGMRGTYRIAGAQAPLALSLRASAPIEHPRGAEAALGLDWKPLPRVPLHVLAERRQKIGPEGRSAFGITVYGGVDAVPLGPLRVDGYGQAGMVGIRRRDLFADGAVRAGLPLGRGGHLQVGAGAWAAAQPGVARVDVGPHVEARLRLGPSSASLSGDWRFRVAGNARPGSGPALTLATDF